MAPLRGWETKGERLQAFVPYGHWKTLTFLAGLRHYGITAPCVFDGPISGASFLAYVKRRCFRRRDMARYDHLRHAPGCSHICRRELAASRGGIHRLYPVFAQSVAP